MRPIPAGDHCVNHESVNQFKTAEARAIVADLCHPNPVIYWVDFLLSVSVAYGFAISYFFAPLFSVQQIVSFFIAGFALHRVANYIHEIAHLKSKRWLKSFCVGWDILGGIPMLMPSFFFDKHMAHHNTREYATSGDCEYIPLGRGPLTSIALFMGQVLIQPLFVLVRFLFFTPISFLHPKLREWVLTNFSSFVFVFPCPHEIPAKAPRKYWAAMDIACSLRAWAIPGAVIIGLHPWYHVLQLYVLAIFPLFLHYFRSLTAHRYLGDGNRQTFQEQLLDSIDITGNPILTELLYPVGLRYHALHHLFPTMPYHNLGIAHRRLMAKLPEDSPYRQVVYPSVWSVLRELIANAAASEKLRNKESAVS